MSSGCNYFKTQVEIDQEYLKSQNSLEHSMNNGSNSIEESIQLFINEAKTKKSFEDNIYLFSWSEYRDIFLPNTLSEDTIASHNTLQQTKEITDFRRRNAYQTLYEIMSSGEWKLAHIEIGKKMRVLGKLKGIPIDYISFEKGKEMIKYDGIRLVVENQGKFKVCVLAK